MPKIPELPQANELKPNDLFIVHIDEQDATNSITFEKIADLFVSISGDTMTGTLEMPSGIATYLEADEGLFNDSLECMGSGFFGEDLTCAGSGLFNNIKANKAELTELTATNILCSGDIEAYGGVTASGGFICPSGGSSLYDLEVENTFSVGTGIFNFVDTSSGLAGYWSMGGFFSSVGIINQELVIGSVDTSFEPPVVSGIQISTSGINIYGPCNIVGSTTNIDINELTATKVTYDEFVSSAGTFDDLVVESGLIFQETDIQTFISGIVINILQQNGLI